MSGAPRIHKDFRHISKALSKVGCQFVSKGSYVLVVGPGGKPLKHAGHEIRIPLARGRGRPARGEVTGLERKLTEMGILGRGDKDREERMARASQPATPELGFMKRGDPEWLTGRSSGQDTAIKADEGGGEQQVAGTTKTRMAPPVRSSVNVEHLIQELDQLLSTELFESQADFTRHAVQVSHDTGDLPFFRTGKPSSDEEFAKRVMHMLSSIRKTSRTSEKTAKFLENALNVAKEVITPETEPEAGSEGMTKGQKGWATRKARESGHFDRKGPLQKRLQEFMDQNKLGTAQLSKLMIARAMEQGIPAPPSRRGASGERWSVDRIRNIISVFLRQGNGSEQTLDFIESVFEGEAVQPEAQTEPEPITGPEPFEEPEPGDRSVETYVMEIQNDTLQTIWGLLTDFGKVTAFGPKGIVYEIEMEEGKDLWDLSRDILPNIEAELQGQLTGWDFTRPKKKE